eukprot:TRINITY_DN1235_c2_g1_i3.p1 TRINITY_DN1235_c2_g1~~TRINITY_DN1235_c2_g1_i3.p1  ORF type:complete len:434 (+),score=40.30 TRINITY_DN1235_c2_g1_i3:1161-2462(+)
MEELQPEISMHAMTGSLSPQTMRVKAELKKQHVSILIDSGSTHNFIHPNLVKQLNFQWTNDNPLEVMVANGERLRIQRTCNNLPLTIQGFNFTSEFYILPLRGCDIVLGASWLRILGPILWDFSKLYMKFKVQGQQYVLKGSRDPPVEIVSSHAIEKMVAKGDTAMYMALYSLQGSETTEELPIDLQQLLQCFDDVFITSIRLPPKRSHDHHIPLLPDSHPPNIRPYRYPHIQKTEIERQSKEMLESGIIRPSNSPYSSPVLLVRKRDGSWRMCIDYRALNNITVKDKFPIPTIDELLDELHGAAYFSKLDLRSGYYQVRVYEEDIPKTTFRTHEGHYEFLVMPFGLTNAPSTLQSLMNSVFRPYLRKFVLVFFDDILIYSSSWEDHLAHLEVIFETLCDHKLFLKRSKCSFGQVQVEYLGHIISQEGVATDP